MDPASFGSENSPLPDSAAIRLPIPSNPKACANCVRVKCKCIYRGDGTGCERCHRLSKSCAPPVPGSRPTGQRNGTSMRQAKDNKRVARLEEKLDRLLSVMGEQRILTADEHAGTPAEVEDQSDMDDSDPDSGQIGPETLRAGAGHEATKSPQLSISSSQQHIDPFKDTSFDGILNEPSEEEANQSLSRFRDEALPFFPFAWIPQFVDSKQAREMYPFFWMMIMSTSSPSHERRLSLGNQAVSIIIQRVVVAREASMDLLLGLLTFVGWSHIQEKDREYHGLFSQLLATLVCDLGLHRPPHLMCKARLVATSKDGPQPPSREHTHVERRAVLGTFLVTSFTMNAIGGPDGLRWSAYLADHLTALAQHSTVSQDKVLVAQVRMQLIANQVIHRVPTTSAADIPAIYLAALRSQLLKITGSDYMDTEIASRPVIVLQQHFTSLLIHNSGLFTSAFDPEIALSEPSFSLFEAHQHQLDAIKAWLATFHAIPLATHKSMPFFAYSNLIKVLISLHRLTTLDNPAWDRAALRRSVDLAKTLNECVALLENLQDGDECYNSWALGVVRDLRAAWGDETSPDGPAEGPTGAADGFYRNDAVATGFTDNANDAFLEGMSEYGYGIGRAWRV